MEFFYGKIARYSLLSKISNAHTRAGRNELARAHADTHFRVTGLSSLKYASLLFMYVSVNIDTNVTRTTRRPFSICVLFIRVTCASACDSKRYREIISV